MPSVMVNVPTPRKTQPERHGTMGLSSEPTEHSSDPSEASEVSEVEEPWPEPSSDDLATISLTKSHNELVARANAREMRLKELQETVKRANKTEKKLLRKIQKDALAIQDKEKELEVARSTNWKLVQQIPTQQKNNAMVETLTPPDDFEDATSAGGQSHEGFKRRSTSTGPRSNKVTSDDRPSKRPKHQARHQRMYSDEATSDHPHRKPSKRLGASPVQSSDGIANVRMMPPDEDDEEDLEETRSTVHDQAYIQQDDDDGEDQVNQKELADGMSSQQKSDDPASDNGEEDIEEDIKEDVDDQTDEPSFQSEADERPCQRVVIYSENTDEAEGCVDAALAVLRRHMVATDNALEAAMDKRMSNPKANMTKDDIRGWDYFCQKTSKCAISFVRSATTAPAKSDPEHTTCKYCFN
ncbi:hypothetical protein TI39_contig4187g00004 [Zymoseptoria brevis]|uniref:Uncharacterized protein n=1 Tax=Zymoseptoria brevis TaxID=1047168 RepID=A0A0F4GBY2_9PEZI|nr:hypothetical protein TI39_contig4187g00004 [Zymoseptoria brevis]